MISDQLFSLPDATNWTLHHNSTGALPPADPSFPKVGTIQAAHLALMLQQISSHNLLSSAADDRQNASARMIALVESFGWCIEKTRFQPAGEARPWTKYRIHPEWLADVKRQSYRFPDRQAEFLKQVAKWNPFYQKMAKVVSTGAAK